MEGTDDNGNEDEDWMIIDKENKLREDDDTVESLADSLVDVPEEGEESQCRVSAGSVFGVEGAHRTSRRLSPNPKSVGAPVPAYPI